jgi:hypothetical protein
MTITRTNATSVWRMSRKVNMRRAFGWGFAALSGEAAMFQRVCAAFPGRAQPAPLSQGDMLTVVKSLKSPGALPFRQAGRVVLLKIGTSTYQRASGARGR